jgi:hypothetical protein
MVDLPIITDTKFIMYGKGLFSTLSGNETHLLDSLPLELAKENQHDIDFIFNPQIITVLSDAVESMMNDTYIINETSGRFTMKQVSPKLYIN